MFPAEILIWNTNKRDRSLACLCCPWQNQETKHADYDTNQNAKFHYKPKETKN